MEYIFDDSFCLKPKGKDFITLNDCFTFQVLKAPHGDLLSCMEMAKVWLFVCALLHEFV